MSFLINMYSYLVYLHAYVCVVPVCISNIPVYVATWAHNTNGQIMKITLQCLLFP